MFIFIVIYREGLTLNRGLGEDRSKKNKIKICRLCLEFSGDQKCLSVVKSCVYKNFTRGKTGLVFH